MWYNKSVRENGRFCMPYRAVSGKRPILSDRIIGIPDAALCVEGKMTKPYIEITSHKNMNRSGIYAIVNTANDCKYVGQTKHFLTRKKSHFSNLKCNNHANRYLQKSFNLFDGNNFLFVILEAVTNYDDLDEREQYWIDKMKPEYNINLIVKRFWDTRRVVEFNDLIIWVREDEYFVRPEWHAWVYGGGKNPINSVPRKRKIRA